MPLIWLLRNVCVYMFRDGKLIVRDIVDVAPHLAYVSVYKVRVPIRINRDLTSCICRPESQWRPGVGTLATLGFDLLRINP